MPSETISERIKSLYFSASELKQITNWPDEIIEEFLNLFSNIELIGKDIDTNTDNVQYVLSPKAIHKLRDYLFKNGKVGGQEVYGGSVTGDDLSLYSNQANDGSINLGASGKTFYDESTDLLNVNGIQLDLTPTSTTIEEGKLVWNADDGTLNLGLPGEKSYVEVGQSMTVPRRVKNTSGSDMSRGQIVYISGVSGQQAVVSLAKADAEATSASTIAFLSEDIANNGNGFAIRLGILRGTTAEPVDTSAYATGNILYLSAATAGAFTNIKPAAPNHAVIVGIVWKVHASEGEILVNIVNGFELYELHDVDDTLSSPTAGEFLAWNSATSLWDQTSGMVYDFTNGFTGINNASPSQMLDIIANTTTVNILKGKLAAAHSANAIEIYDSANNLLFNIEPDGEVVIPQDNKSFKLGAGLDAEFYYNGTDLYINSDLVGSGSTKIGTSTDNFEIEPDGEIKFNGQARIKWQKITADNVTLTAGTTPASTVSDLQTKNDGNVYHIDEAAATPGIHLEIEFINVTAFNWVEVMAAYQGSATHYVLVQLYNFNTTSWDIMNCMDTHAAAEARECYCFFVADDTNYIGTGGDAGDVRVRLYHTVLGNASHDLDIDVVALYQ